MARTTARARASTTTLLVAAISRAARLDPNLLYLTPFAGPSRDAIAMGDSRADDPDPETHARGSDDTLSATIAASAALLADRDTGMTPRTTSPTRLPNTPSFSTSLRALVAMAAADACRGVHPSRAPPTSVVIRASTFATPRYRIAIAIATCTVAASPDEHAECSRAVIPAVVVRRIANLESSEPPRLECEGVDSSSKFDRPESVVVSGPSDIGCGTSRDALRSHAESRMFVSSTRFSATDHPSEAHEHAA